MTRLTDVTDPAFLDRFRTITSSWFRLECLQHYAVPEERSRLEAFLSGQAVDRSPGPWQQLIREHTSAGRHLQRVHIVVEPLSPYINYELSMYPRDVAAGEDVRILPTNPGEWPEDLPGRDFWLLDDSDLWLMHYDHGGALLGVEHVTEPWEIAQHVAYKQAAVARSMSLADYETARLRHVS